MPGKDGGYPTVFPTVPDVSNSLIRFLSIQAAKTVRITSKFITPAGAELGYPSPVTRMLFRRLVGSKSFPSLLPATHSAWPRLPSGGSLGPHFPTFPGTVLGYDCPVSLSGRFASARSPIPCLLPPFVSRLAVRCQREAPCQRLGSWSAGTPPLPAVLTRHTGLSQVPEFPPCCHAPLSSDPGGVLSTGHPVDRTAAFRSRHGVGFGCSVCTEQLSCGPPLY